MYRKILIAADPEGLASGAAPAVAALAEPEGVEVRVATVEPRGGRPDQGTEDAAQTLVKDLETRRFTVHLERRESDRGSVADTIGQAAREFDADLIVLGSRRHGDVAGFFAGSVGHALAAQVPTPILVVSKGTETSSPSVRRVLVAVDGGAPAHQAVVATAALAGPDTEVVALYVDNPVGGLGGYGTYVDPSPTEAEGTKALDDALTVLREANVKGSARRVYSLDGTGVAIARAADEIDADLIVLASRRPGNVEALLLGSVAHEVIAHTQRAVLLAASERE